MNRAPSSATTLQVTTKNHCKKTISGESWAKKNNVSFEVRKKELYLRTVLLLDFLPIFSMKKIHPKWDERSSMPLLIFCSPRQKLHVFHFWLCLKNMPTFVVSNFFPHPQKTSISQVECKKMARKISGKAKSTSKIQYCVQRETKKLSISLGCACYAIKRF